MLLIGMLGATLVACAAMVAWALQWRRRATALEVQLNHEQAQHASLQTDYALLQQQLTMQEQRLKDWEAMKEQSLQAAKASVIEAGSVLSTKLLEDHKREAEAVKKDTEEKARNTTKQWMEQFEKITEKVGHLHGDMAGQKAQVDTLWQAMSQPAQAGRFAEIGLENSLQSFGLEPGRDYLSQMHIAHEDGTRYRPDILIFLPNQTALVLDSKASTFLLDVAAKEGTEDEAGALESLKHSMREHLRILSGKQYHQSVQQLYREAGMTDKARRVLNVMYVPHDATLERLYRADPEFQELARGKDIIVSGPSGLSGLLALAKMDMTQARQLESHEAIIQATEELLESVVQMTSYMAKAGRGLKTASDQFAQLCKSANSRLLPRARKLEKYGVHPAKNKQLPPQVSHFHLIEDQPIIEAEEVTTKQPALEGKKDEPA